MCSEDVVVRNAANPPQHGKSGVRAYVTSFRDRTARRRFNLLTVAEHAGTAYARWTAALTFRAGVSFGPATTLRPFDLELQGICRFKFDACGLFREVDVFHETTTAIRLAQEAAKEDCNACGCTS
jgi:SnoaL-like domain